MYRKLVCDICHAYLLRTKTSEYTDWGRIIGDFQKCYPKDEVNLN